MDALGKSPIPVPLLITGKLCMLFCWLFFIVKNQGIEMLYDSTAAQIISGILAAAGVLFIVSGFICLGNSVSVGLPEGKNRIQVSWYFLSDKESIVSWRFSNLCSLLSVFHPSA